MPYSRHNTYCLYNIGRVFRLDFYILHKHVDLNYYGFFLHQFTQSKWEPVRLAYLESQPAPSGCSRGDSQSGNRGDWHTLKANLLPVGAVEGTVKVGTGETGIP